MAASRSGTSYARVRSSRMPLVDAASSIRASTSSAWPGGFGSSFMTLLAPAGGSSPPSALTLSSRVRNEDEVLVDQRHRGPDDGGRPAQVVAAEADRERLEGVAQELAEQLAHLLHGGVPGRLEQVLEDYGDRRVALDERVDELLDAFRV